MGILFPSQPLYRPTTPEEDGFPHARFTEDHLLLDFGGGKTVTIPYGAICRDGVTVKEGGTSSVNSVIVELLVSEISVVDECPAYSDIMLYSQPRRLASLEQDA